RDPDEERRRHATHELVDSVDELVDEEFARALVGWLRQASKDVLQTHEHHVEGVLGMREHPAEIEEPLEDLRIGGDLRADPELEEPGPRFDHRHEAIRSKRCDEPYATCGASAVH